MKKTILTKISWYFVVVLLVGCSNRAQVRPTKSEDQVDVIVIGAGMAGLSAARELKNAHKSFIVLEAQNRIGGRAMLGTGFNVPIDLGAAWFHGVEDNPLVPIADAMGFHRVDTELNGPLYVGNRKASPKELEACNKTGEALDKAMQKHAKSHKDQSVGDLLVKTKPCADVVASNVGPLENGAEINHISSVTAGQFNSDNDDFLKEGLGAFVAAYGKDIPVRLNSVVNKIAYGVSGVSVTLTTGEVFHANRVLVTVSTGILASGKIAFEPPLPKWKTEAISKLPMGLLNKVVLQFKKDIFKDTPKNSWVMWDGPGNDNVAFVIRPLDAPIAVAFYGGNRAWAFEKNESLATNHAKDALRKMFGADVDKEFDHSLATSWGQNPWTLGSFSYVTPGASNMHRELIKPVDNRVFFAGEACARPESNGSLHGAYESSLEASKLLMTSLAELK